MKLHASQPNKAENLLPVPPEWKMQYDLFFPQDHIFQEAGRLHRPVMCRH